MADDAKAEVLRWYGIAANAQSEQALAMDRVVRAEKREAQAVEKLRECGKAVGETDLDRIVAAVRAFVREHRKDAA